MHNRFFQLPLTFDPKRLAQDLATCESDHWTQHFNQRDYAGEWNGVALRSTTGRAADIYANPSDSATGNPYTDTPLLAQCPYFREILDQFQCETETVRLLSLAPGSVIKEHRDMGLGYQHGSFRLHIPIETDAGVRFRVDGSDLAMAEGECWYANFDLPHSVLHEGKKRRVHLIIDGQRNAWSDELFRRAGYDFEAEQAEPVYDDATRQQIIEHLMSMDTDVARQLIANFQAANGSTSDVVAKDNRALNGWFPVEIKPKSQEAICRWMYLGDQSFTESFFETTLSTRKGLLYNSRPFASLSSVEAFFEATASMDAIPPTAFIFHVSRCGSTLLSQLLSLDQTNIVLSEAALIDQILRWPFQHPTLAANYDAEVWVKAVIQSLGQRKNAQEQRLFIKLDSWHLFFYPVLRRLYPQVPFILLYRSPEEVLRSHQKQRGFQVVPGALEPEIFGVNPPQMTNDLDSYCCEILERYYAKMLRIAETDNHCHLANYREGAAQLVQHLSTWTNWPLSNRLLAEIDTRQQYHAKHPHQVFSEIQPIEPQPDALKPVVGFYQRLEEIRKS